MLMVEKLVQDARTGLLHVSPLLVKSSQRYHRVTGGDRSQHTSRLCEVRLYTRSLISIAAFTVIH